jgi:flagellar motor switch protein FliM
MRALQSLHEGFGRNFGAALSALLRSIVEVKLTSVDQLTYSEFVFSLENPTCFNLLRADPLEGNLILDINPSVLYPVIDRLLGGGKETGPLARRPLTEIELRLVARITGLFLKELQRAWQNVVALELTVERVESNPQLVQIVPPNEVVVVVSFELTIGDIRGMMNLCIPFNSIERIGGKLTSNSWVSYSKSGVTAESRDRIGRQLDGALVEVVVTLADSHITTADLVGLRVGDIIATNHDVAELLEVSVAGSPKFRASCGALKGRKAIQISEKIEPGK